MKVLPITHTASDGFRLFRVVWDKRNPCWGRPVARPGADVAHAVPVESPLVPGAGEQVPRLTLWSSRCPPQVYQVSHSVNYRDGRNCLPWLPPRGVFDGQRTACTS
jgi:hypothetical protein